MSTKKILYLLLFIVFVLFLIQAKYHNAKEINWFKSYATHHKIPYGTYVLNTQLERIFTKENTLQINEPPFLFLKNNTSTNHTYLFVNTDLNFDDAEIERLLHWTAKGNTLYLAAENFSEKLLDTLKTELSLVNNFDNFNNQYQFQLANSNLQVDSIYYFNRAERIHYFSAIDTLKSKVISSIWNATTQKSTSAIPKKINALKLPYQKGTIILSTFPQAFTNFFILENPNQNYTAGMLSYLNTNNTIYVDNFYKNGKSIYTSPMYIFLNTTELKWAYYIVLIGVLIYIIFEGKRKQRAIPIQQPLTNETLNFTRTIANMYYEKSAAKEIALQKINYFLTSIRNRYNLDTTTINKKFIEQIAARSNNTIEDTQKLFETILVYSTKETINNQELTHLNTLIENYN